MRTSKVDNCSNPEHSTLSLKSNIELIVRAVTYCLPYPYLILKGQKNSSKEECSLENISLYVLKHFGKRKLLNTIVRHACIWDLTTAGGSESKESACNAGDLGSIRGSGRYPREGNGSLLHCFCLGNPMDRGTWRTAVCGFNKDLNTTEQLTLWLSLLVL